MKTCTKNNVIIRKNSDHCIVSEFPIHDDELNFAVVQVTARYPDSGLAMNTQCKEIVYVQAGSGSVVVDGKEIILSAGDVVLIEKNEKFYWDGNMTLHIACTPAFTPEQHIHVKE